MDLNETVLAAVELVTYALRTDEDRPDAGSGRRLTAPVGRRGPVESGGDQPCGQRPAGASDIPGARRISVTTRFDQNAGTIRLMVADNGPACRTTSGAASSIRSSRPSRRAWAPASGCRWSTTSSPALAIVLEETPAAPPSPPNCRYAPPAPRRSPDQPEAPARTGALRLLIVDDDPEIALTLAEMLEPDGHAIDIAENGAEALERLEDQSYDLIISDLRMPELDGPGLYRELGARFPEMQRRIFFVTGDTLGSGVRLPGTEPVRRWSRSRSSRRTCGAPWPGSRASRNPSPVISRSVQ